VIKGSKQTKKAKIKVSEKLKGRRLTLNHRKNISKSIKNKNLGFIKGHIPWNKGKGISITKWRRLQMFKRDNFTCQYCGRNIKDDGAKLELDHIIPLSKGGKNTMQNAITACNECNQIKKDKIL